MQTTPEAAVDENAGLTAPHPKQSYLKANIATVLAIAIAATATWITAMSLVDAHGIGPTHFGQAADAGRRAYSGVFLWVLDGVALVLVAALARLARRGFRSGR
ncbi:hypothetical protein [Roseateles aquatilis]|nr:hypothetical protein [Roseateles aquatilis]